MCACTKMKTKLATQVVAPESKNSRLITYDARKLREGYRHDLREGINE